MTTTNTDSGKLDSPAEVSEYLGVPTSTLSQWRWKGEGPAFVRAGRIIRYRRADVEEWLAAHRVETVSSKAVAR